MMVLFPIWLWGLVIIPVYWWMARRFGWHTQGWLLFAVAMLFLALSRPVLSEKPVTVGHARLLAGLILRQLESMASFYLGRNEKLDKLWDVWMASSEVRT